MREGGIIINGGHCKGLGIRVELESTMKMKSENESENDHFCRIEVRFNFSVHSCLILKFIFEKMKTENELKMA